MSYDLKVGVRVYGTNKYVTIATPELDNPTYNLGVMFRKCTGWDFKQGEWYSVVDVMPKIEHGIKELSEHPKEYKQYEPSNAWGTVKSAERVLRSLKDCINDCGCYEDLSYDLMYVRW